MADTARTFHSLPHIRRNFTGQFNMAFMATRYYFSQGPCIPTTRQAILAFIVPIIINYLELMYQGKDKSPFETHPKSMQASIVSLLIYCLAFDAKLRFSSTHPTFALVLRRSMVLFGSLAVVTLASILFADSIRPVLYLLYILFSASKLLNRQLQILWNWLHQRIMAELHHRLHVPGTVPSLRVGKKFDLELMY